MRKGRDGKKKKKKREKNKQKNRRKKNTSLPAVDRPNADRWNAAHSRQFEDEEGIIFHEPS